MNSLVLSLRETGTNPSDYRDNHIFTLQQYKGNWEQGITGYDTSWGLGWHFLPDVGSGNNAGSKSRYCL